MIHSCIMRMDNFTNICEATSQSHELDNYRPTHRKGKKLLAEKKRRARINNCLMQIRDIVCEGEEEKDTDLEKMEKAEILEKTLEVLTRLRHDYSSQTSSSFSTRKAMAVRYASGFSSCAEESIRYIQNSRLVPAEVKIQLQSHLRAIAHRMEASLQGDSQNTNFPSIYPISTLSSPTSSDRLTDVGELRDDKNRPSFERVPDQMPDSGTYYVPSPIHFSTPGVHSHMPLISQLDQQECVTVPDALINSNLAEHQMKHSEHFQCDTSDDSHIHMKHSEHFPCDTSDDSHLHMKHSEHFPCDTSDDSHLHMKPMEKETCSTYSSQLVYQPHSFSSVTTKDKQFVTSFVSPGAVYPPSAISLNEATPSNSSPVIVYSSPILSNTSLLSDQPIFSYQVYEPYTVPSILVQPITYLTTPIRPIQRSLSTAVKQPSTLSNALDLCVKRSEDHQISPETMWRPW